MLLDDPLADLFGPTPASSSSGGTDAGGGGGGTSASRPSGSVSMAPAGGLLDNNDFNPNSEFSFDPTQANASSTDPVPLLQPESAPRSRQAEAKVAVAARRVQHEESIDQNELRRRIQGGGDTTETPSLLVRARASLSGYLARYLPKGEDGDAPLRGRISRCVAAVPGYGRARVAASENPKSTLAFGLLVVMAVAGAWHYHLGMSSGLVANLDDAVPQEVGDVSVAEGAGIDGAVEKVHSADGEEEEGKREVPSQGASTAARPSKRKIEGGMVQELKNLREAVENGHAKLQGEVSDLRKEVARLRRGLGIKATGAAAGAAADASAPGQAEAPASRMAKTRADEAEEEEDGPRDYGDVRTEKRKDGKPQGRQPRLRGAKQASSPSSSASSEAGTPKAARGFGEVFGR